MERNRINLDVDGVVGNFNQHCEDLFGAHPHHLTFDCPERGLIKSDAALWAHVDREPTFWTHMPIFPWADQLIDLCRPYGVQFVTGCPRGGFDRAVKEKNAKLNGHWPGIPVIACLSKDKSDHMQRPGDILVDDMRRNCERWEAAGGYAVRFRTFDQAFADLKTALLKQFPEITPPWKDAFLEENAREAV